MTPQELFEVLARDVYVEQAFRHQLAVLQAFLEFKLFSGKQSESLDGLIGVFIEAHPEFAGERDRLLARGEVFYDTFTTQNLYELLEVLNKRLETLPTVTLYLPIEFPSETIADFGRWFKENVESSVILNVSIEPDVATGCAFVWNGVYHDFSFRYFARKHEESLRSLIREYGGTS